MLHPTDDARIGKPSDRDLLDFATACLIDCDLTAGIRITTVRTQLASILRKVGAERQADLVRILSSTGIGSVYLAAGWLDFALAVAQLPLSLATV